MTHQNNSTLIRSETLGNLMERTLQSQLIIFSNQKEPTPSTLLGCAGSKLFEKAPNSVGTVEPFFSSQTEGPSVAAPLGRQAWHLDFITHQTNVGISPDLTFFVHNPIHYYEDTFYIVQQRTGFLRSTTYNKTHCCFSLVEMLLFASTKRPSEHPHRLLHNSHTRPQFPIRSAKPRTLPRNP